MAIGGAVWPGTSWLVVKDIALTGTGLVLIVWEAFSAAPSDQVLIAGLALTGIGASFHVGKLVSGHVSGPPPLSPSPPRRSSSPPLSSPPEPEGTDDSGTG